MERAMLWFKCAAVHDPVRPVLREPAVIGWEAKLRKIDLVIGRPFRGDELLRRMNGWFTVDVSQAIQIFNRFGRLKILDDHNLVIETEDRSKMEELSKALSEAFGEEAWIEPIPKKRLD
ncbi:MAG: hypothetical protein A2V65_08320 [Deltaproteobacteria bacterium RBG_13_49_15]|nr:MAG: hypothetical protein A2V65_08320 [Deltaproteobacteria bacterium RBG_13_49_15]